MERQHFAIGLVVHLVNGALPCGWADLVDPEDTDMLPETGRDHRYQIQSIYPGEPGYPYGSIVILGWNYSPQDVVVE